MLLESQQKGINDAFVQLQHFLAELLDAADDAESVKGRKPWRVFRIMRSSVPCNTSVFLGSIALPSCGHPTEDTIPPLGCPYERIELHTAGFAGPVNSLFQLLYVRTYNGPKRFFTSADSAVVSSPIHDL
jgi:hypothetical protein